MVIVIVMLLNSINRAGREGGFHFSLSGKRGEKQKQMHQPAPHPKIK